MFKQDFWKKEIKLTRGYLAVLIAIGFLISGLASGFFLNYVFPHLTSVPLLSLINPRLPVVVNKTEQVVLNDNFDTRDLYNRLKNVTVSVFSYPAGVNPESSGYKTPSTGQGIVVTTDGLIFSTKSVVGDIGNILYVVTSSGDNYLAELLAFDPKSSLAVLKIKTQSLPLLSFGAADELLVGDKLVAVAGALGRYDQPEVTVTASVLPFMVTDYGKVLFSEEAAENFLLSPALPSFFTGGGLISRAGKIIGFLGDGQILPGEYLQSALDSFLKQHSLARAALGARYIKIAPPVSVILELPADWGILLAADGLKPAVSPESAVAASGLREGDFIYKINGESVDARNTLEKILDAKQPGEFLEVDFYRDGKPHSVVITLKKLL